MGSGRGNLLDSIAIGISLTCLVHCLALPVLLALLPAWSSWLGTSESFHLWVLLLALPFSLVVLWQAALKHAWFGALWVGSAGLVLMAAALAAADPVLETGVTSAGALLLAAAHLMNWRRRSRWH
jgi:hypothetical protein